MGLQGLITNPIYYHRFPDELSIQYRRSAERKLSHKGRAESRGRGAGGAAQGAQDREQGEGKRKQEEGSRKQKVQGRDPGIYIAAC